MRTKKGEKRSEAEVRDGLDLLLFGKQINQCILYTQRPHVRIHRSVNIKSEK